MASLIRSAFLLSCVTSVSTYGYIASKARDARDVPADVHLKASVAPINRIVSVVSEQPEGALPICRTGQTIGWVMMPGGSSASAVNDLTNAKLFTLSANPARSTPRSVPSPWPAGTKATPAARQAKKYNGDRPPVNHRDLPTYSGSTRDGQYVTNAGTRARVNAFSRALSRNMHTNRFSRELSSSRSRLFN